MGCPSAVLCAAVLVSVVVAAGVLDGGEPVCVVHRARCLVFMRVSGVCVCG